MDAAVLEVGRETVAESAVPRAGNLIEAERVRQIVRETLTNRTLLANACENMAPSTQFVEVQPIHQDRMLCFLFEKYTITRLHAFTRLRS